MNIVCIGGGNGMPRVLASLKPHNVRLTAVVTMADNGGSAGLLREYYGTLPNGDIRRALAALATTDSPLKALMTHRFKRGPLDEQSAGSIFLTSLENVIGSFERAVDAAARLLKIRGEVLPVTLNNVQLRARLSDGTEIYGETDIDVPKHNPSLPIKDIWLEPEAVINPRVSRAIGGADMIIIGPGDLYTSLVPNLLVKGVPEAINASKAIKVFLANLKTKRGETHDFTAEDFVREIEKYVILDKVVFNSNLRDQDFLKPPVASDKYILADVLADDDIVQHDSGEKLANVILSI